MKKEELEGAIIIILIVSILLILAAITFSLSIGYDSGYSDRENTKVCQSEEIDYREYPQFDRNLYDSIPEGNYCLTKVKGSVSNLYALVDEQNLTIISVGWINEYGVQTYKKCIYGKDVLVEPKNVRHTIEECMSDYQYCIVAEEGFYYGFGAETITMHYSTINEGG